MKYSECDRCHNRDDASCDGRPFLGEGVVVGFRGDDPGDDQIKEEKELCKLCADQLKEWIRKGPPVVQPNCDNSRLGWATPGVDPKV